MNELHTIQNQILNKLMFSTGLKYSQMKPNEEMENNQFQFHLDQLLKKNLVSKIENVYQLTFEGKQYIKKMDSESGTIVKQPHLSVRVCCIRKATDTNVNEYLFYTRLKHPYYGCQGFPAGKLIHGEIIKDAALRELYEETKYSGIPELVAITHYLDLKNDGTCITDKIMFLYVIKKPTGTLTQSEEGFYEWIKRSKVKEKIKKPFENIEGVLEELDLIDNFKGQITFIEKSNIVEEKF